MRNGTVVPTTNRRRHQWNLSGCSHLVGMCVKAMLACHGTQSQAWTQSNLLFAGQTVTAVYAVALLAFSSTLSLLGRTDITVTGG